MKDRTNFFLILIIIIVAIIIFLAFLAIVPKAFKTNLDQKNAREQSHIFNDQQERVEKINRAQEEMMRKLKDQAARYETRQNQSTSDFQKDQQQRHLDDINRQQEDMMKRLKNQQRH